MHVNYYSKTPQLTQAHKGDAGFDIYADLDNTQKSIVVSSKSSVSIPTGLFMEIDPGYYGKVCSRSGLAFKSSVEIGAGVIDAGYRGEVKVKLYNHGGTPVTIKDHDKIAQIVFLPLPAVQLHRCKTSKFSNSKRGSDGFGSSGT